MELDQIYNSDSLRIVPREKRPQAEAALRFLQALEAGTAMIKMPEPGGEASNRPNKPGQVWYRSLAGDVYDAEIVQMWPGADRVDIDVIVPGVEQRERLWGIRWVAAGASE